MRRIFALGVCSGVPVCSRHYRLGLVGMAHRGFGFILAVSGLVASVADGKGSGV